MNAAREMQLDFFQDGFFRAVLDRSPPAAMPFAAIASQPGFAVYRNTVVKGSIDALAANFPTVERLVGEEWFRAAAAIFARESPPRHPALVLYGECFADFLAGFAPAAELTYLPGVARLDRCWSEAHVAADAPILAAAELSRIAPDTLGRATLALHPAARWAYFPDEPVYAIWRDNREGRESDAALAWRGDGGLVTRAQDRVEWRALDQAGCAFLDACAGGLDLGDAALAAMQARKDVDLRKLLATLLETGTFSGFTLPDTDNQEPR
jgi:hypothetical protein